MQAPINPQAYYANNTGFQAPAYPQMPQYGQPYQIPQYQQMPVQAPPVQQTQRQAIVAIPVESIDQAKNYPAMETTYFFDKTKPAFYIKDAIGFREFYENNSNQNEPSSEKYVTKEEFDKLYKMVDDLTK